MKKSIFLLPALALFLIMIVGCSKDDKNEPENPGDVVESEYLSLEEYKNKVSNRLWETIDAKWIDDDGNVLHDMFGYMLGWSTIPYFYFHDSGCVVFSSSTLLSRNSNRISEEDGILIVAGEEILTIEGDTLYIRGDRGRWREDPELDPNAQLREDVYYYYTLVEKKDPDWSKLLSGYRPNGYNPEDYGMK